MVLVLLIGDMHIPHRAAGRLTLCV